jgi:hypothetical protein
MCPEASQSEPSQLQPLSRQHCALQISQARCQAVTHCCIFPQTFWGTYLFHDRRTWNWHTKVAEKASLHGMYLATEIRDITILSRKLSPRAHRQRSRHGLESMQSGRNDTWAVLGITFYLRTACRAFGVSTLLTNSFLAWSSIHDLVPYIYIHLAQPRCRAIEQPSITGCPTYCCGSLHTYGRSVSSRLSDRCFCQTDSDHLTRAVCQNYGSGAAVRISLTRSRWSAPSRLFATLLPKVLQACILTRRL